MRNIKIYKKLKIAVFSAILRLAERLSFVLSLAKHKLSVRPGLTEGIKNLESGISNKNTESRILYSKFPFKILNSKFHILERIRKHRKLAISAASGIVVLAIIGVVGATQGWFTGGRVPSDTFTRGLAGYWNFEEGMGNKAYDQSDSGSHGTLYYMVTSTNAWAQGRVGWGLNFDGVDDYVSIGDAGTVRTVEFWINDANAADGVLELSDDYKYVSISGSAITTTGFTSPTIYINGKSNSATLSSGWNHVVIVNGADINATSTKLGEAGGDYLEGYLDEVRIYNRELSKAEVRYHYNRGGPVLYLKFDEGSGTTAYDNSNNSNNGTLMYMSTSTSGGWVAGRHGDALQFDGIDDFVSVANDETLDITEEVTVDLWVYVP